MRRFGSCVRIYGSRDGTSLSTLLNRRCEEGKTADVFSRGLFCSDMGCDCIQNTELSRVYATRMCLRSAGSGSILYVRMVLVHSSRRDFESQNWPMSMLTVNCRSDDRRDMDGETN